MDNVNCQTQDAFDSDSVSSSAIPLAPMRQQIEVRAPEDDWTGIQSAAERRKLQNRLNARIYRKRRGANQKQSLQDGVPNQPRMPLRPKLQASGKLASDLIVPHDQSTDQRGRFKRVGTLCNLSPREAAEVVERYASQAYHDYVLGSPRVDQLLTLIQFNVFRALVANTGSMGFANDWMSDCGALSPFLACSSSSGSGWASDTCPESLRPTELQRQVPHHPWFDLFPFPAMRDNILLAGEDYDDEPLCLELVEFCHIAHEQTGLVIWGEPHDPMAWEVSESFMKNWGWVLKGVWELKESTNRWRVQRGEQPLVFEMD
ncbi:hypothetical protein PVAG01_00795 [Phlyctema vagabunda]|uniref:BZIP domain-containing protein n=1 Tax=Phlyctema vagabunda TaxID=108571 RepID=A0ABR4PVK8_9HELO